MAPDLPDGSRKGRPAGHLTASRSDALRGSFRAPGDKSISHRALILGALAKGKTHIRGLLEADDVLRTASAVRAFGAKIERIGEGWWTLEGREWQSPDRLIDCGNSGTGARLLMGAAAGFPLAATFVGDGSLNARPMARVLEPLRAMGARATGLSLPVTIEGGGLTGIRLVNERASAQVKSAILLAGLRANGPVEVIEPSPSRDHTETMLRAFGCDVSVSEGRVSLGDRRALVAADLDIPGDPSSAAFPLVAALVVPGSEVAIRNVMMNPLRSGLFTTLCEMGADLSFTLPLVENGETVADVSARTSALRGVEVPASRAPSMIDEYPILAIAAAFAEGRTVMRGLGELRVKESDRLSSIVAGLKACGVEALIEGDDLIVEGTGSPPSGDAAIATHGDHRLAMSFLVMGLGSKRPVTVDGARMIGTSYPAFAGQMRELGGRIE